MPQKLFYRLEDQSEYYLSCKYCMHCKYKRWNASFFVVNLLTRIWHQSNLGCFPQKNTRPLSSTFMLFIIHNHVTSIVSHHYRRGLQIRHRILRFEVLFKPTSVICIGSFRASSPILSEYFGATVVSIFLHQNHTLHHLTLLAVCSLHVNYGSSCETVKRNIDTQCWQMTVYRWKQT
jgi:hypothetical protein